MYDHFFCVCKSPDQIIRPQPKNAVNLVTADDHFNLSQWFVWICMDQHAHFITPKSDHDSVWRSPGLSASNHMKTSLQDAKPKYSARAAIELARWFFANNSVIIESATMKFDQNLVCLTP